MSVCHPYSANDVDDDVADAINAFGASMTVIVVLHCFAVPMLPVYHLN